MTYSAKANPNATNSELDSKRIITHKELTSLQRDELIEQFVEIQIDSLDMDSLVELASEYITQSFDRLTDSEIKERIESLYDAELYEELVDNVTSHIDPRLASLNTDRLPDISDNEADGITDDDIFIDINNTGGKY